MAKSGIKDQIRAVAVKLLEQAPEGLRYSALKSQILGTDSKFNQNTVHGSIHGLTTHCSEVYKPAKGLYRLLKYKPLESETPEPVVVQLLPTPKVKESAFYEPFSDWLVNEMEDATHAIALGGSVFKDKWGTPDVIGKRESLRSDIIKAPTEIISAEIKTETLQLVTAFGQACAYKLFSHRAYLVVPSHAQAEEISRLDSLCQIFGIGLVTFNADSPAAPEFRIRVRPARHEPDLFWTNKYVALIEKQLFA